MPSARYTDWTHVHVVGDRDRAALHVPYARKLLGWVMEDAAHNQLGTHKATRKLADGTVVVAEKHGEQPRITIIPAADGVTTQRSERDGFVAWARDASHTAGIDDDYPQQILKPSDSGQWGVYTFRSTTDGNRTGTYRGTFLDGLTHAGNCDWVGPDRERISWYGPTSRYFADGWVQPRRVYGSQVFMLGEVLLDITQYASDSNEAVITEAYILGAALKTISGTRYLYAVQCACADMVPTPPETSGYSGYFTAAFPTPAYDAYLCRYKLTQAGDDAGVQRLSVVPGSRVALASIGAFSCEPWVFNTSCTEATIYQAALTSWVAKLADHVNTQPASLSETLPDTSQSVVTITITDTAVTAATSAVSVTSGGAAVAIATDYADDIRVDLELSLDSTLVPYIQLGGLVVPFARTYVDGQDTRVDRRMLLFADLRTSVLVFYRFRGAWKDGNGLENEDTGEGATVEVYKAGALVHETDPVTDWRKDGFAYSNSLYPNATKWASLAGVPHSPAFWAMGFFYLWTSASNGAGDDSAVSTELAGLAASNGLLPLPGSCYFGYFDRVIYTTDTQVDTVASFATSGFASEPTDAEGRYSWLGCVSDDDVVLLSCIDPSTSKPGDASVSFVTGTSLGTLTGIAGTNARYHPLWTLGQPPKALS